LNYYRKNQQESLTRTIRSDTTFSLKHTGDSFRKVVIDGHPMAARYIDNDGICHINLIDSFSIRRQSRKSEPRITRMNFANARPISNLREAPASLH